jgi:hypothetical protein
MGALCSKPKGGATTVQKPGVAPPEMKKLTTKQKSEGDSPRKQVSFANPIEQV